MNRRTLLPALCALLVTAPMLLAGAPAAASTPGSWGTAQMIETDNGISAYPQVAVDGSGNAIAVWIQFDGSRNNVWANRYDAEAGWGTPGLVETDNAGSALGPQVALDPGGNATAVWTQSDGIRDNLWASRYVPRVGWGTPVLVETNNSGSASSAQVAVGEGGDAVAVWVQWDGAWNNIWANRYAAGAGWGTAELIEAENLGAAYSPQVGVDDGGNTIAVWHQSDGTRMNVWANRFVAGTGWGTAEQIETDNGGADAPQVAVGGGGSAVAAWTQYDGTRYNIWANRYVAGTGWGLAESIETDNAGSAFGARVALDDSGNATAVWRQYDGIRDNIWANRFVQGTGWGTAELIETDNAWYASGPQVAVDASGFALAVWQQSDGLRYNGWANRYVPGSGWGTAELIELDNSGGWEGAVGERVAVDASGNAIAVWYQSDGTRYNIWANRFVEDHPPALTLSLPVDGSATNRSTVWVSGTTEPGATLSVNGLAVFVAPNGSFAAAVALTPGRNLISATAWDRAGNRASAHANVTFADPLPALELSLAGAQAALAAANAGLAATQAELAAAQEGLASAQARVSALEANGSATAAQLAAARSDLAAAQARVGSLEAGAVAAAAELNATRARLASAEGRTTALESLSNATQADLAAAKAQAASASAQAASASAQAGTAMIIGGAGIGLAGIIAVLTLRKKTEPDA